MVLARALVAPFAPTGPILLGRDDTLCRKRGLTLFGAGMHHDPLMSSKALKVFRGGTIGSSSSCSGQAPPV